MTPDLLRRVGESLYGVHWHGELARALNISVRNVRRWVSGEHVMNAWALTTIASLCEEHSAELMELARVLRDEARAADAEPRYVSKPSRLR